MKAKPTAKARKSTGNSRVNKDTDQDPKKAEGVLNIGDTTFRSLIENSNDIVTITEMNGIICYESPSVERNLGYKPEEMVGKNAFDFVHPEDLPKVMDAFARSIQNQSASPRVEYRFRHKDGSWVLLEGISSMQVDESDQVIGIINSRDITERKQAEAALRRSEIEYRGLFENVPDGIYRTKPDGQILSANPALVQMFGYDTEEQFKLSGGAEYLYLDPADRKISLRKLEEDGEILNSEIALKRRDGSLMYLLENARAIKNDDGRTLYYEGVLTDITERKQAELELQHRREDLELINSLNAVVNRGESLDGLLDTLSQETKRIYSAIYCTVSLLDPDEKVLTIQRLTVPPTIMKKIGQLIGQSIPKIQIPIKDGGQIQRIIQHKEGTITSDPYQIKQWLTEFTESTFLSPALRKLSKKLVPQIYRILKIGSTLAIPLISNGRTFGLLELGSAGLFTEETLNRVRNVGEQTTGAILRKQAEEAERDQRNLAEALRDTAEILSRSLDFGSVLDQILNIAERVVPHDSATVMLIEDGKLHLARNQGYEERGLFLEKNMSKLNLEEPGNLKQIFESREPVLIPDVFAYPDWKPLPGTEWLRSNVGAPLLIQDNVIGFLLLDSGTPGFFTPLHAQRLQAFANQAAIAVQNARLFEAAQIEITERRQAEEKLKASESELRALFAAMQDVVLTIDKDGVYRKIAPTNPGLLVQPPEELLGKSLMDVFPPEQAEEFLSITKQVLKTKEVEHIEYNLLINGQSIWFGASITPMTDDMTVWVAHDITYRKEAQKAINRQLEELSALHMVALAGIQATNVDELIDRVTQIVGDTFFPDHFGVILLDENENVLRPHPSYRGLPPSGTPKSFPLTLGVAGKVASSGQPKRIADIRLDPDYFQATSEILSELCVPIQLGESVIGVLNAESRHLDFFTEEDERLLVTIAGQAAVAIDNFNLFKRLQLSNVELERRVEERTAELSRMNVELTHANRTKDEFLTTMSHELRTPLNSVLGFSESLLEQRRGPLNEKQQQYVSLINSSGQHLLGLINDILEVSKIEAGKLDLRPDIISVNEVCESSLNFIKEMAVKKSIRVEFKNESSIASLRADPQRLKQILVNLLNNAVKFTPEKGKVSLEVRLNNEKDQIQFSVRDNGIGIAHDDQSKLFIPFSQIDSSLSRQYEGTGLGLALALKLTELHSGSVKVESEPNQGSCFTINLPWSEDQIMSMKEGSGSSNTIESVDEHVTIDRRAVKILLAEDNLSNVLTIQEYLSDHGFEVAVAHNGVEAIAMAEKLPPNIILMDIQMPIMNGMEAIGRLRANARFATTPIIALTALSMPGDRERCLEAGANEYLSKPVSLKGLIKTIGELLAQ